MYYDYSSTTCSSPSTSRIRIARVAKPTDTRTHRNIHSQRESMCDDSTDHMDYENATFGNYHTPQTHRRQPSVQSFTQPATVSAIRKDSSMAPFLQKKRKNPNEDEPMVVDVPDLNNETNLRLESIENTLKELRSEQKSIMKSLEKIYQAQLATLSHQKLSAATARATDIPPIFFNGINLVEKEPPIEPTALLCSSIRKLYTHDEIKNGIAFDERSEKIKELIKETYFKELPVEFDVFWQRQAKKTIGGQKRSLCSRDKHKEMKQLFQHANN